MRFVLWLGLISVILLSIAAQPASASYDEGDIAKAVKAVAEGKHLFDTGGMDKDRIQIIQFEVLIGVFYQIDIKARTCYYVYGGPTIVPCRIIKKGYPLFAPLITWDKDSWAE
jgi:hypothetical protein